MTRRSSALGSLRFRITASAALVMLAMLVVTGFALVASQHRQLEASLDGRLERRAEDLRVLSTTAGIEGSLLRFAEDDIVVQLVDEQGTVIAASTRLLGFPAIAGAPGGTSGRYTTVGSLGEDHRGFRVLSLRTTFAGRDVILHVAADLDDLVDSRNALVLSLVVAVPTVTLVLALVVWFLVGRTLRPVEAIRAEVASMSGSDLHRRVSEPGGTDEIARLATTMNSMLARVEVATRRQLDFAADASHELRTPLARVRAQLEVETAHPSGGDRGAIDRSILHETIGLQSLVDDLLFLARSDDGSASPPAIAVDLDDIVFDQAALLRAEQDLHIDISAVSGAQTIGDRGQLARVVRNLADNAARHARTTVRFELSEADDHIELAVSDDGPGIPVEQRTRVFERFNRVDTARSVADGGTGLGLAIANDIVIRHGGTITIDPGHEPGARFVVTLPKRTS